MPKKKAAEESTPEPEEPEQGDSSSDGEPSDEKPEGEGEPEPDAKELAKQLKELQGKLEKLAPPDAEEALDDEGDVAKEEDKEKEKKEKEKEKEKKPAVDPAIIDYANFLKTQLGQKYDKDLDKLPIRARIGAMKGILKVVGNQPSSTLKEGKIPKGTPGETNNAKKFHGVNFKELGKKY